MTASVTFEQLELEEPRSDEAVVRIVGAGVCHTDALVRNRSYETPLPAVLGHEGSGIVDAVGSAIEGISPGDHVVLSVNSCGRCRYCLTGDSTYCVDLYPLNFGGARIDGSTALRGPNPFSEIRRRPISPSQLGRRSVN